MHTCSFLAAAVIGSSPGVASDASGIRRLVGLDLSDTVTVGYRIDLDPGVRVPIVAAVAAALLATVTASASWVRLMPADPHAKHPTIEIGAYPVDDASSPAYGILTVVVRDATGTQLASGTEAYTADAVATVLRAMAAIVVRGIRQIPHRERVALPSALTLPVIPPAPTGWSRPYRIAGTVLAGAGVAALGIAGWQALEWQSSVEAFRAATDQPTRFHAKEDGEAAGATADVALGVGGAVATVGITMLILDLVEAIGGSTEVQQ